MQYQEISNIANYLLGVTAKIQTQGINSRIHVFDSYAYLTYKT